jgi:putative phage-type endonuclease
MLELDRFERYPDRAAWLEARRKSIGASDSPKILGLSVYGSPVGVFADKLALMPEDPVTAEAAEWGLLLEPLVAARYARETGLELLDPGRYTLLRSTAHPFLHASPDRLVQHPTRGLGVLSIKTASAYKAEEWSEEVPPAYQVQVQHELLVTGLAWASVAVLIGGQRFRYLDCVERDATFIERLLPELETFWAAVQRREPPSVDASEACRLALRQLYPREEPGTAIALDPALGEWDDAWLEAKKQTDYWGDRKTLCEHTLIRALGPAAKGVLPSGVAWTYKSQTRKEFIQPEKTFRVLRRTEKRG